jgi:hypothetical protein
VVMPGPFEIDGMRAVGALPLPGWAGHDAAVCSRKRWTPPSRSRTTRPRPRSASICTGSGGICRHFCLVYFGAGLGLGSIIGGQPYRGAFGNAGEIGHIPVRPERASLRLRRPGLPGALCLARMR